VISSKFILTKKTKKLTHPNNHDDIPNHNDQFDRLMLYLVTLGVKLHGGLPSK
jgi:hypothetical protein